MIVQCGRCLAKFRFDDRLMHGEGVWVRCSLCQNEFFQSNPIPPEPEERTDKTDFSDAGEIQRDREEEVPDLSPLNQRIEIPDARICARDRTEKRKRRRPSVLSILIYLLATLLVLAGIGILAFPEIGKQTVSELSVYLPWLEKEPPQSIPAGIQITEVKQRFIANIFAGNLRVVEGVAQNKSGRPLTRLVMRATLMDKQDVRLGEKQSYAGNMLSDAELTTLTEEEINHRLANPQGSAASNDRIMPGGRIPFMIVWGNERPGAIKTFVSVAGAEPLLQ